MRTAPIFALLFGLCLSVSSAALAQNHTNPVGNSESYPATVPAANTDFSGDYTNQGDVTADGTNNAVSGSPPSGGALQLGGAFINDGGMVAATGTSTTSDDGVGIWVGNGFTNQALGAITASGSGTASGSISSTGYGIFVNSGGFTNSGSGDIITSGTGTGSGSGFGHGAGSGIFVNNGGFINSGSGDINASGSSYSSGFGLGAGSGIYVNSGGFINSGSGAITASGAGGSGIYVNSGGFTNSGSGAITASGSGAGGSGINIASGGFTNSGSGAITASGADGSGINIASDGFTNSGSGAITASGSNGSGIFVTSGGFTNSDSGLVTFLAEADTGGTAYGLHISSGDLTNAGRMTLAAQGANAYSIGLDASMNHTAAFKTGSTLYLAEGGNLTFVNTGGGTGGGAAVTVEPGARVISLVASTLGVGQSVTHDFIKNADSINANFITPNDNGVLQFTHNRSANAPDATNYSITVTRTAYASAITGGEAGKHLAVLENYWRGRAVYDPANGVNSFTDPSINLGYLYILANIENAADVPATARLFFGETAPQAVTPPIGQSIMALNRGQQVVTGQFMHSFLGSFPGPETENYASPAGYTVLWGRPFFHTGTQNGGNGLDDLDQDFTGISLGAARMGALNEWGQIALGASLNYLSSDFDSRGYTAEADGIGFSLGLAARFNISDPWNPRLALYGGWMTHDFEQNRRIEGLPAGDGDYSSNPDAEVWNIGLSLDNDFNLTPVTIFRPRLALDYARTSLDGYTEHGPSPALVLAVDPEDYESLRSDLGASLIWQATPIMALEGRADWYHEFKDTEAQLTAGYVATPGLDFAVDGPDSDRNSGSVGAGFTLTPTSVDWISLKLDYDFHFGGDYTGHELGGLLKIEF